GILRVPLHGIRETASFVLSPSVVHFHVRSNFAADTHVVIIRNVGTQPLQWQEYRTPVFIDPLFRIERIEPIVTLPGDSSRLLLRFAGIRTSETTTNSYTLRNSLCAIAQTLSFSAGAMPQAILEPAEEVRVRLLCEAERTILIPLHNVGTAPLQFMEPPRVLNDTANEVRILDVPVSVAPGERQVLQLHIRPLQVGTRVFRLVIVSNDNLRPRREVLVTVTKDSSLLQFETSRVELGIVRFGERMHGRVRLFNRGTVEQHAIATLRTSGLYLDSIIPHPIPAGRSADIYVHMIPTTSNAVNGVVAGILSVQDSCRRESSVEFRALPLDAALSLPDSIVLAPREEVAVPIVLHRRYGVQAGQTLKFVVRIANTSLVQVVSPSIMEQGLRENRVVDGARHLSFQHTVSAISDTVVVIRLRGLLGSDSLTTLRIDSAALQGIPIHGATAYIRIRGINYAGGSPRLYYTPAVRVVVQNPAYERLAIRMEALETAYVTLRLVSILGHSVHIIERTVEAGQSDIVVPLGSMPAGVYALEVWSTRQQFPAAPPERTVQLINILR
ncbi:MAG: hypothetical protein RML40_11445, partial [Bacteroidota bacterium]|nr:hypothetical protein [Candidatus Kapabacteria bacterium]MDW8221130.1 hypothetical protein [Bacteroidota bacterium]